MALQYVPQTDPEVADALRQELNSPAFGTIELIASENIVSPAVMEAMGSVLTNKYAEGYARQALLRRLRKGRHRREPGHRARHGSCSAPSLPTFSPTPAHRQTMRPTLALIKPGDTVLGMSLDNGGHLTHGSPGQLLGQAVQRRFVRLGSKTRRIDYDRHRGQVARNISLSSIVAGASAYPRIIDFERMCQDRARQSAHTSWSTWLTSPVWLPRARIPAPVPYADITTTTTP